MSGFKPAAKPEIRAVLDYAGVRYQDKRGGQKVLCPAHADRKPSCSLDLDKGLWNCLSCGASGDAWTLLMITEGISFKDAVKLAEDLGLPRSDELSEVRGRVHAHGTRSRSALVDGIGGSTSPPGRYTPSWRR